MQSAIQITASRSSQVKPTELTMAAFWVPATNALDPTATEAKNQKELDSPYGHSGCGYNVVDCLCGFAGTEIAVPDQYEPD